MKVVDKRSEKQKTYLSDIPQGSWFETDRGLLGLSIGPARIKNGSFFIPCLVHASDSWLVDELPASVPCQTLHAELVILD